MAESISGATAIIGSLAECGVRACFANPGTSEMHLVTALDREPRIRSVLCLFEGVATGAADGYARMSGVPALTLLHLGPGYLNGGANIHNAKRAFMPMINLIGDHATTHRAYDAPLASDIRGLAGPNSRWLKSVETPAEAGKLAAEAFAESYGPPPGPVSLLMPANSAWDMGGSIVKNKAPAGLKQVAAGDIEAAAKRIKGAKAPAVLLNGTALSEQALGSLARLKSAGVRVINDTFIARQARGGGRFTPDRVPYFVEMAIEALAGVDLLLVAGTKEPVAFFAYPNAPARFFPHDDKLVFLGGPETDSAATMAGLAEALGAKPAPPQGSWHKMQAPVTDKFNAHSIGLALTALAPEGAIISDDGVTSGLPIYQTMAGAAPHDWLGHTGGAIGQGMPMAIGAAVASPDRKVICLAGDGAGMYTVQALWTMARENLDVCVIVFVNNVYRILRVELQRTGAGDPGPTADQMLALDRPEIQWAQLAQSMGVAGETVSTQVAFNDALARAMKERGPRLIAAKIPA